MTKKPHSIKRTTPSRLRSLAEKQLQQSQITLPDISSSPEEMIRVIHELSVHQIELEMQQDELEQTRSALEKSWVQYRDLYEEAPLGYLTLTRECRILQANLGAKRMFPSLMKKRLSSFVADEAYSRFNIFLEGAFSSRQHQEADIAFLDNDTPQAHHGSTPRRIFHCDALVNEDSLECRLTLSDITDLSNARQENASLQEKKKNWDKSIHSLFDNFADPVFLIDTHYSILAANAAFTAIFDKSVEECLNINALDLLIPELRELRMNCTEKVIATAKPLSWEDEQNDATLRHTIYPITDKEGKVEQLLFFVQNITQAKAIERKLQTEASINQSLIQSIPGIFFMTDQNGLITRSNEYLRSQIIGDQQSESMNIGGLELVHPDDREKANDALQSAISSEGGKTTFEGRVLLRGGPEYRWFVVTAKKVTINRQLFLICVGTDITEHKQLEKILVENEERFRTLFESHAAAKLIIDPENASIVDANEAAANLYGWPIEKLCQLRIDQIQISTLPPEELRQQIDRCVSNEEQHFIFRNRIADGSIRDVEVFSNSIEIGGKPFVYAIIFDITERKRLEALADSILAIDLNGAIISVSNMGLDLYGARSREELLGLPFSSLLHPRDIDAFKEALATVKRERTVEKHEFLLKRKDNTICSSEISLSLVEDSNGAAHSYLIILRDISQRKLIESEHLFKKTLIGLGEMAAGIAHEIYQPINTIGLVVDKMLVEANTYSGEVKSDITKTSKKLLHNIERIETIVDTIRSFAGKESKKGAIVFDSNTTVRAAMDIVSLLCSEKEIALDFTTAEAYQPVSGNIYKFEQVILNLIRNSIDALEEKMEKTGMDFPMKIQIDSSRDGTSVVLRVQDSGIGIRPEELDYITQPFYTTKTSEKGTGLGLSISQGVIKEMHGTLLIESKPLQGTTVTVTVPLKECAEK